MNETRGQRVKRLRERKGLSQNKLGALVGVTGQSVWLLEHDRRGTPGLELASRYAEALDVSLPYFLYGFEMVREGEEIPTPTVDMALRGRMSEQSIVAVKRFISALEAEEELERLLHQQREGSEEDVRP